jgi:hypothetical protein
MIFRRGGSGLSKYRITIAIGSATHLRIRSKVGLAWEKIRNNAKAALTKKWK